MSLNKSFFQQAPNQDISHVSKHVKLSLLYVLLQETGAKFKTCSRRLFLHLHFTFLHLLIQNLVLWSRFYRFLEENTTEHILKKYRKNSGLKCNTKKLYETEILTNSQSLSCPVNFTTFMNL